ELHADVAVALRAGLVDRLPREQALGREVRHRVVAVAARQVVALVDRTAPVIARTAGMAGEAGAGLHLDRRAGIVRVADDQAFRSRILGVRRTRTVAGFANRDRRIGAVRGVQAERMEGVREVLALERVARDAHA